MRNKPIPYHIKEDIARKFHFTAKSEHEIAKEYNIVSNTAVKISMAFPPEHFNDEPNRIYRSLWIITKKLQQVANSGDMDTLHRVAKILSRV